MTALCVVVDVGGRAGVSVPGEGAYFGGNVDARNCVHINLAKTILVGSMSPIGVCIASSWREGPGTSRKALYMLKRSVDQ